MWAKQITHDYATGPKPSWLGTCQSGFILKLGKEAGGLVSHPVPTSPGQLNTFKFS